jgi:sigma-E factor negative regulatory protein RseA
MEEISAMMDGELDERRLRHQFNRLREEELFLGWHTFHLIGDALRGERPLSPEFNARLGERLALEPTVLAPRRSPGRRMMTYALSAAASLAAVALVGWVGIVNNPLAPAPDIAQAPPAQALMATPAAAPVAAPAVASMPLSPVVPVASIPSDGEMNEYLIAHQEFSPSTALQGLAPYIRSVSGARAGKERR